MNFIKFLITIYLGLLFFSCEKNPVKNKDDYPVISILVSTFKSPTLNFALNRLNPENIIAYPKKMIFMMFIIV